MAALRFPQSALTSVPAVAQPTETLPLSNAKRAPLQDHFNSEFVFAMPPTHPLPESIRQRISQSRLFDGNDAHALLDRKRLGGGGHANIFKITRDGSSKRALKVYKNPGRHVEGALLQTLRHPNIISALNVYRTEDDLHCIELEYQQGSRDLDKLLHRLLFSPKSALQISIFIASALDYMHQTKGQSQHALQIVHGDIKPSNILMTPRGELKLIDFSVATTAEMRQIGKRDIIEGTLRYMDPFVLYKGQPMSHASDVHGLLVTMCELILGRHAHELIAEHKIHPDEQHYNAAVDRLIAEVELRLTSRHPNLPEAFTHTLTKNILSSLRSNSTQPLRITASELAEQLQFLLPEAPGKYLNDVLKNRSLGRNTSTIDDQNTILAGALFMNQS